MTFFGIPGERISTARIVIVEEKSPIPPSRVICSQCAVTVKFDEGTFFHLKSGRFVQDNAHVTSVHLWLVCPQ